MSAAPNPEIVLIILIMASALAGGLLITALYGKVVGLRRRCPYCGLNRCNIWLDRWRQP
jgi:hypothetical protein